MQSRGQYWGAGSISITKSPLVKGIPRRQSQREHEIRDEERRQIARELHDSTSQLLVALQLSLARLRETIQSSDCASLFSVLDSTIQELHNEVRAISSEAVPPLRPGSLPAALQKMAADFESLTHLPIAVEIEGQYVTPGEQHERSLFRIAQEALANVQQHANAHCVKMRLTSRTSLLKLTIADDGVGFAHERQLAGDSGRGLQNIRQRVREFNGRLRLQPLRHGSLLSVAMNLPASNA